MARVRPYKNKDGVIVSYTIIVFRGKDSNGKELKPYTTTWKIPENYKTEKAILNALNKAIGEFETACNKGITSINKNTTFEEYSNYYIKLSERDNKHKTYSNYKYMLTRILPKIGYIKLSKLTANDLNDLYFEMQTKGARQDQKYYSPSDKLSIFLKENNIKRNELHHLSNVAVNTITLACQGKNIALETAQKISNSLNLNFSEFFLESPSKTGLSEKTIMNHHKLIHGILEQAIKEGEIFTNVAAGATPPKVPKHRGDYFEIDEIIKIGEALNHQPFKWRVFTYLLIDTGARRGEILGIQWSSVDFKKKTIQIKNNSLYTVEKGIYPDTPKTDEFRTLSVSSEIIYLLRIFKEKQDEEICLGIERKHKDNYIFTQQNGNPMHPDSPNKFLNKFAERYNLPPIHPHKFRHSQASILIAMGSDIITVAERLGHKDRSTTLDKYGHLLNNQDRKASDTIANTLYRDKTLEDLV